MSSTCPIAFRSAAFLEKCATSHHDNYVLWLHKVSKYHLMSKMCRTIWRLGSNCLALVIKEERNRQQQAREESEQAKRPLVSEPLEHLTCDCIESVTEVT